MKLILILFLIVGALTSAATALTIDEYIALPADEKIQVLKGKPDKVLDDLSKLLELHTISLSDESPKVQWAGAISSYFLVQGLQHDKARSVPLLPEFTHEDSAAFQEALVAVLEHDDPAVRFGAAAALAYSTPPNPRIEAILLERIESEDKEEGKVEFKNDIIRVTAEVGYNSERFVALTLELMHSEDFYRDAADVLILLTPEVALDTLIELVQSKEAPARWRAVKVLAAYGSRAMRAKPVLERLIEDQTLRSETREDIHKLAARTLEAITSDKPEAGPGITLEVMKLVQLWPLVLPGVETEEAHELNVSTTESDEPNKLPSRIASKQEQSKEVPGIVVTGDRSDSPEELREHTWIWLGTLVLVIIAVWIVLKRRR